MTVMKFKPASSIPHDLRLITRFEAAKLLRCTTQTITNWVNKGVIKGHWIDKYLFVDRQSIEELFDTASDVARMEDKLSELKSKISEELSDKQQELIDLRKSKQITNQKKILRSVVDNSICIAKDIFDDKDNAIVTGYLQGKTTSEIASELNVSVYKVVKRANKSVPILLSRLDYNALRDENRQLKKQVHKMQKEIEQHCKQEHEMQNEIEQLREIVNSINFTRKIQGTPFVLGLSNFEFPVRLNNALVNLGCKNLADVVMLDIDDNFRQRKISPNSIRQLNSFLAGLGLYPGMDLNVMSDSDFDALVEKLMNKISFRTDKSTI